MKKYKLGMLLIAILIFQINMVIHAKESKLAKPDRITKEKLVVEDNKNLREMILNSPETLELLHEKGLQIHNILDSKWRLSPLEYERLIRIDEKHQRLIAFEDGLPKYIFTCSTRAPRYGKSTHGVFNILGKYHKLRSKMYNCWMPYALHIYKDVLIHRTTKIHQLGRPASHGCIRLHPKNAAILFHKYAQKGDPVEFRP